MVRYIEHADYEAAPGAGKYRWYFSETAKSPFIAYFTTHEAAALWEFEAEGLALKSMGGNHYLGAHLGTREELEAWVQSQLEAWAQWGVYPS